MTIKLSGKDVTFGRSNIALSGNRAVAKSGIRECGLSGSRITGVQWNGNRLPPPEAGCVLYLPGYPAQGSAIKDFSGQSNDGTIVAGTWKGLKSGVWCLSFNGTTDQVTVTDHASLNPTSYLTVELWVYLNSHKDYNYIIHKEIWVANGWGMIGDAGGAVSFNFRNTANANWNLINSGLTTGSWQHIRVTMDYGSPSFKLYRNDALVDTKTSGTGTISPGSNSSNLYLGATKAIDGDIAMVRINNTIAPSHYQQERHLLGV